MVCTVIGKRISLQSEIYQLPDKIVVFGHPELISTTQTTQLSFAVKSQLPPAPFFKDKTLSSPLAPSNFSLLNHTMRHA
jgi:hypothetical protein